MPVRPNGSNANTIPPTQFFHEWVHELNLFGIKVADSSRGKPSYPKDKDAHKAILEFWKASGDVFPYGTNSVGEKKFRDMAAQGFTREYKTEFRPEQMIFTPGGQFGISSAFHLVETLYPGSVVVAGKPWYLNHHEIANMFGEKFSVMPAHDKFHGINLLESGVQRLTAEHIEKAIEDCKAAGKKIGAFLFCNPMNPLGLVTRKHEWIKIAKALDKYPDAMILLDEAFAEIVFDEDYEISLLHAAPHLNERTIVFRSGTKALGYPGERLAVMSVPKKHLDIITAFQSRLLGNAPLSSQAGMAAAIYNMDEYKKSKISKYYKGNYESLSGEITKLDHLKVVCAPEGGFYMMVDFSSLKGQPIPEKAKQILQTKKENIETDFELAISLMVGLRDEGSGVATIPASSFGANPREMLLRLSFSSYSQELTDIADNLADLF